MSDLSFVRTEFLPEQSPPASTVGLVGWARANLFSGWLNTTITVVSLLAIFMFLKGILPWIFSPTWSATSLSECREILAAAGRSGEHSSGGACWGVIRDRWVQLVFGFYPSEFYWRPVLCFVLLFVALAPP